MTKRILTSVLVAVLAACSYDPVPVSGAQPTSETTTQNSVPRVALCVPKHSDEPRHFLLDRRQGFDGPHQGAPAHEVVVQDHTSDTLDQNGVLEVRPFAPFGVVPPVVVRAVFRKAALQIHHGSGKGLQHRSEDTG